MMSSPADQPQTAWIFAEDFLRHNARLPHPERPERLRAIVDRLHREGLTDRLRPLPFAATDLGRLTKVHTDEYLNALSGSEGRWLDPDTYVGEGSPAIARFAAGGVIAAAEAVWHGRAPNAFCAVRPPGHHALADHGMGFCLLNNIALAATAILAVDPLVRIFILDWDVHHGNGTQAIFYESPQVMYASVHQYPFYPGTGAADETGDGPGRGFTVNHPLPAGSGDREFLAAIDRILDGPARRFAPDMILVSAGFDADERDPLAQLRVTTEGFARATTMVCALAAELCRGRVVSVLEGGYDLTALADDVAAHVTVLADAAQGGGS